MNFLLKTAFIFLISIVSVNCYATNYTVGQTLNVVAFDGLVLRSKPGTHGKNLTTLQTGETVTIQEMTKQKDSIFGFSGNWVKIQTKNQGTGYVFDAFLSTLPIAKSISDLQKEKPESNIEPGRYPVLLSHYTKENFTKGKCVYNLSNHIDGESTHNMKIQTLEEGHTLVEHGYWEANSTELILTNVRSSEIYYLVHQLFKDTDPKAIQISDQRLRNPSRFKGEKSNIDQRYNYGESLELYQNDQGGYTLHFYFSCC